MFVGPLMVIVFIAAVMAVVVLYDPLARGIGPWHSTASSAPKWCSIMPPVRVKAGLRAKEIAGLTWAMLTGACRRRNCPDIRLTDASSLTLGTVAGTRYATPARSALDAYVVHTADEPERHD